MENKEFMIVSNNKLYLCKDMTELISKIKVLETFKFTYQVYYLCQGEWTEMLISSKDILETYDKGLSDGLKGANWDESKDKDSN